MSLNLISSLSLLKSRLEKSQGSKVVTKSKVGSRLDVRRLNSTDMFGGITESDLDTSSSDDDEDDDSSNASSRPSSPSGFNTPETNHKDEPTQVHITHQNNFLTISRQIFSSMSQNNFLRLIANYFLAGYSEEVSGDAEQ